MAVSPKNVTLSIDQVEILARAIASMHGSKVVVHGGEHGPGAHTLASLRGSGTGFAWEIDTYVERHWREYDGVPEVLTEAFKRSGLVVMTEADWSEAKRRELKLQALEDTGVADWDGFDDAMETHRSYIEMEFGDRDTED